MAESDSTTVVTLSIRVSQTKAMHEGVPVHIDFCGINAKNLLGNADYDRKRFVDLEKRYLVNR